jgi:uncharacterized repeat protein (TIGR02543 family)
MNQNNQTPGAGTWVWRPRLYEITFMPNEGMGTMAPGQPRHPAFEENYTLAANTFTKEGYTFTGWNTAANGTGAAFAPGHTFAPWSQVSDMTLFAQWEPLLVDIWTVTFDLQGGTANPAFNQQQVNDGDTASNPGAPSRAGSWVFDGWFDSAAGGLVFNFGTAITEDMTIYARWRYTGGNNNDNNGGGGTTTPPPTIIEVPEVPLSPFVDDHIWYVRGFPDGSFRPGNSLTRAEVAMILWRLLDSEAKHLPQAGRFSDVQSDGWYVQAVNYLASRTILSGFPDGTFRPNAPITRAELTAVMSRFFDINDGAGNGFADVTDSHWAFRYINNAHNRGWVTGFEDGTFRPNNATIRAEAVTIINRVLSRTPNPETIRYWLDGERLFNDLANSHWAYYQIMEAAIEHDFELDAQGREIWLHADTPWREGGLR